MNDNLKFPTELHERYISELKDLCTRKGLSLILKGSLAKGTSTKYSDIDILILGNISESVVDSIIICHGMPVMTNYTENPKGIVIIVYEDGISVDLDFRTSMTYDELQECTVLVKDESNFICCDELVRYYVSSKYLPVREQWYKDLRLGHRAMIKFLAKKEFDAMKLLKEMKEQFSTLGIDYLQYDGQFKNDIVLLLEEIFKKYSVENRYEMELKRLLKCLQWNSEGQSIR